MYSFHMQVILREKKDESITSRQIYQTLRPSKHGAVHSHAYTCIHKTQICSHTHMQKHAHTFYTDSVQCHACAHMYRSP